jgi:nucleoside-diphosphate-sugar epimerase
MTILITGATGRVGSRFARRALDWGERVRVLVREASAGSGAVTGLRERGAETVIGDLRDTEAVKRAVADVQAVVHIAAAFRGTAEEETVTVNRDTTAALATAALDAGVTRFVFTSTNLVYGAGRGRPAREADAPAPPPGFGAYPASKAEAEAALQRLHAERDLDLRVVRLAFVYGEGDAQLAEAMGFVRQMPAHQRMHLVHHADASQGLWRALQAEGAAGRVYNCADDAPVTAHELHVLNGEWIDPEAAGRPLADPWFGIVDTARIRDELGFRPLYPTVYTARDAGAL